VIVGSSAAALTGLQFVVLTLIAQSPRAGGIGEIAAFGTPTVVHFCAVLLIAAIVTAPWSDLGRANLALDITGVAGIVYTIIVLRRALRPLNYKPVFEDWLWHTILPLLAYTSMFVAAITFRRHAPESLFVLAGAALLLLFIGIHNAWDTVTYITVEWLRRSEDQDKPKS